MYHSRITKLSIPFTLNYPTGFVPVSDKIEIVDMFWTVFYARVWIMSYIITYDKGREEKNNKKRRRLHTNNLQVTD